MRILLPSSTQGAAVDLTLMPPQPPHFVRKQSYAVLP